MPGRAPRAEEVEVRIIPAASGKSWRIEDDAGHELGIITMSESGKHRRTFFHAWSVASNRHRWDLAAFTDLEGAAGRVEEFAANPAPYLERVHRVSSEAVEKRR